MTTYREQASAPAPSTSDIHPTSHGEFATKENKRYLSRLGQQPTA